MTIKVILEATAGPLKGRRFVFEEHDTFIFGRSRDCHAQLSRDDTFSSRHHFLLEVNPPQARIRDLGSLNGTYINGVRYGGRRSEETPQQAISRGQAEVDLKDQDEIQVGETVLRLLVTASKGGEIAFCQNCGSDIPLQPSTLPELRFCRSCAKTLQASNCLSDDELTEATQLKSMTEDGITAYQIVDLIGRGGMGTVHRARRIHDGKMVALKVMIARVMVDDRTRAMFLREIEITKELNHPNIVQLLDHGAKGGDSFFFVMDLYPKGSLQNLVEERGQPLPPREAVLLVLDALDGIDFAHQRGFVHRDIKPENILLAVDGGRTRAVVADFGLAKNFELAGLSGLTATGMAAGTPKFMPREQLLHYRYVNPVSDLWSLSATLYYVLTGKLPREFPAHRDPIEVVLHGGFIPLKDRDPRLPTDLCEVIDRTLSDEPDRRPQSAKEMSAQLRSVMNV